MQKYFVQFLFLKKYKIYRRVHVKYSEMYYSHIKKDASFQKSFNSNKRQTNTPFTACTAVLIKRDQRNNGVSKRNKTLKKFLPSFWSPRKFISSNLGVFQPSPRTTNIDCTRETT